MSKLPPFLFAGFWFLRTVLVTYLFPLTLGDIAALPLYCAIVFVTGGLIGQLIIRSKDALDHLTGIGFAIGFLVFVISCLTAYALKARSLMVMLDPVHYPLPPSAYAGVDNGALAAGVGAGMLLIIVGPIMFAYVIWISICASKGLEKFLVSQANAELK